MRENSLAWYCLFFTMLLFASSAFSEGDLKLSLVSDPLITEDSLLFECEGKLSGDKNSKIQLEEGAIGYPGQLEIRLFCYDETVDPDLLIGSREEKIDKLSGNYGFKIIKFESKEKAPSSQWNYVKFLPNYSRECWYYIQCVYKRDGIKLNAAVDDKSSPQLPRILSKKEKSKGIEVKYGKHGWYRLDVSLWWLDGSRIKILDDSANVQLEVYDSRGIPRKTTAKGSKYQKLLKLDGCPGNEAFTVLVRINGDLAEIKPAQTKGDYSARRGTDAYTEYDVSANILADPKYPDYRMRCYFVPYNIPYDSNYKKIDIYGTFPAISESDKAQMLSDVESEKGQTVTLEIPTDEWLPDDSEENLRITMSATSRSGEEPGISIDKSIMDSLLILRLYRDSNLDREEPYRFRAEIKPQSLILPPFTESGNNKQDGNIEGRLNYSTQRVYWYHLSPPDDREKISKQMVTVLWDDKSSEIDMDVYEKYGAFYERAYWKKETAEGYEKSVSLDPDRDYFIAVSLNSAGSCKFKILVDCVKKLSELDYSVLLQSRDVDLYEYELPDNWNGKPVSILSYQETPRESCISLAVSDDNGNLWKPVDTKDKNLHCSYIIEGIKSRKVNIRVENGSNREVKYWLKAAPVESKKQDNSEPNNDNLWDAEQMIDLTRDGNTYRVCKAKGTLDVSAGDAIDYWKINIDEDIVDGSQSSKLKVEVEEEGNVKLKIFPLEGFDRVNKHDLISGVYTYYIGVYTNKYEPIKYVISCSLTDDESLNLKEFESIEEEIK